MHLSSTALGKVKGVSLNSNSGNFGTADHCNIPQPGDIIRFLNHYPNETRFTEIKAKYKSIMNKLKYERQQDGKTASYRDRRNLVSLIYPPPIGSS